MPAYVTPAALKSRGMGGGHVVRHARLIARSVPCSLEAPQNRTNHCKACLVTALLFPRARSSVPPMNRSNPTLTSLLCSPHASLPPPPPLPSPVRSASPPEVSPATWPLPWLPSAALRSSSLCSGTTSQVGAWEGQRRAMGGGGEGRGRGGCGCRLGVVSMMGATW